MAQIIKIQRKSPEILKNKRFEELPKKESMVKPLQITKANKEKNERSRNGNFQMGITPNKRAKIIEDGRKIK